MTYKKIFGGSFQVTKKELGDGSYGRVYLGFASDKDGNPSKDFPVAVKKLHKEPKYIKEENNFLSQADSRFVIKMLKCGASFKKSDMNRRKNTYQIFEYCHGDLSSFIKHRRAARNPLSIYEIGYIMHQLVEGISYIRDQGVVHRDLKPENIFIKYKKDQNKVPLQVNLKNSLAYDFDFKLGDFGFMRKLSQDDMAYTLCGTPYYMAPEMLRSSKSGYGYNVDLWSLGVIFYKLLTDKIPFKGRDTNEIRSKIKHHKYIPKDRHMEPLLSDSLAALQIPEHNRKEAIITLCSLLLQRHSFWRMNLCQIKNSAFLKYFGYQTDEIKNSSLFTGFYSNVTISNNNNNNNNIDFDNNYDDIDSESDSNESDSLGDESEIQMKPIQTRKTNYQRNKNNNNNNSERRNQNHGENSIINESVNLLDAGDQLHNNREFEESVELSTDNPVAVADFSGEEPAEEFVLLENFSRIYRETKKIDGSSGNQNLTHTFKEPGEYLVMVVNTTQSLLRRITNFRFTLQQTVHKSSETTNVLRAESYFLYSGEAQSINIQVNQGESITVMLSFDLGNAYLSWAQSATIGLYKLPSSQEPEENQSGFQQESEQLSTFL